MGRRHVVNDLPLEQREWIFEKILDGRQSDRKICQEFQQTFRRPLSKSAFGRWRNAVGDDLADHYESLRQVAAQLKKSLKQEDADGYQIILRTIEDRLLTAQREIISADPLKLIAVTQEEGKRRLQQQMIDLQRDKLALEREKLRGVAVDRGKLTGEFLADLLEYIGEDPEGLRWFKKRAKGFESFIGGKYSKE